MASTTRSSLTRLAAGMLVPLALAGTCLAAPALADTASASAASTATAATTEAAATEGTVLVAGGIQITVPGEWSSIDLGDMMVAASEDDDMYASVIVLDAETAATSGFSADDDAAKQQDFFDASAKDTADAMGATVATSDTGTFDDGGIAYLYVLDGTGNAESLSVTALAYIPAADGSVTMLTVGADPTVEGAADTLIGILETVERADTTAEASSADKAASEVELETVVMAGGLVLNVPADMDPVVDEDATEDSEGDLDLMTADGLLYLSVMPDIFAGEELTSDEDLKTVVDLIAAMLGGEAMDFTTINNNGVTTKLYAFVLEVDDVKMLGSLGFTEVADGTTTCVMGVCLNDDTTDRGAVLDAIYNSIALSE